MPKTIKYNLIEKFISTPRIDTYKNFFQDHSTEEIYGVYLWNKTLCGAMYPLLQALEIALRNAINSSAVAKFGDYWYNHLGHHMHDPVTSKSNSNHINLVNNFEKARRSVVKKMNERREKAGRTVLPNTHRPPFDLVVASTDFSTWEYALHPCHYRLGGSNFLWPKQTKKAFKNWPHQSSLSTQTFLYDAIVELRPFRNRLSHHEPLWKGASVQTEAQALKFINQKIDKIEAILNIISKDKTKLLDVQKMVVKVRHLASENMLDICRYRARGKEFSFKHKNRARKFFLALSKSEGAKLIVYAGRKFLIEEV